jgi:hypothetical protein
MTNLSNRNDSLSPEALREEVTLRIAETRTQCLRTRELIGQSRRLTVDSLRILIFNCRDQGTQKELWYLLFNMLNEEVEILNEGGKFIDWRSSDRHMTVN